MRCFRDAIVVMAGIVLTGCISSNDPNATFSRVRVSSMGPGQYMISCVDGPGYCANQANRQCGSTGYDVTSNVVNPADFGRMTMIIRCR